MLVRRQVEGDAVVSGPDPAREVRACELQELIAQIHRNREEDEAEGKREKDEAENRDTEHRQDDDPENENPRVGGDRHSMLHGCRHGLTLTVPRPFRQLSATVLGCRDQRNRLRLALLAMRIECW